LLAIRLMVLAAVPTLAAPNPNTVKGPAFPGILANARYVHVASYDGDQFDPNLLPEDRNAIFDRFGTLRAIIRSTVYPHTHGMTSH
jgi:hypothetical protein